ncbi:AAA family ATPase [Streptomyces sp. NPDC007984]|uniref:NACHT N-terminal helical domain 7-containing protein n=1 Tax=Streptomyces sp. NPDC007984 TaxID=3364801 RepID=UPI0036EE0E9A
MTGVDAVAAFWRPLKDEVTRSGISRQQLCGLLNLSPSALSELLNGKRAKAPDWDVIREVVTACGGSLSYWRRRLDELVRELDAQRAPEKRSDRERGDLGDQPGCPVCQDAYEAERFQEYAVGLGDEWDPAVPYGAGAVLAGRTEELRDEMHALRAGTLLSAEGASAFRDQFHDLSRGLMADLGRRVRRSCHPHRVRLLHAAHTIVVVEGCVAGPLLDAVLADGVGLDLNLVFENSLGDGAFAAAPLPVANTRYDDHHSRVVDHYATVWARLTGRRPSPQETYRCVSVYESRLAELASECPELFVWAGMQDGSNAAGALGARVDDEVRDRLRELYHDLHTQKRGLDGLETLLRALARRAPAPAWSARLSEIHRRALNHPVSPISEAHRGRSNSAPRVPTLSRGYVNPAFRTAVYHSDSRPHVDAWWSTRPLRQEIQGFLAGHFSGFPTVNRPMLILGDPGAGKSLLTRLLAARLPPTDYLPIRVELRNVTADAEILDQIAQALRDATNKDVTWDSVTSSCEGVLPVLILDGLDELLQAGGADHWYYLEEIAHFQERSAEAGLPVAAVVTSRTVVADQAKIPDETVIIRLEPFDAARIARWSDVWNTLNQGRRIPALPSDLGALHPDLAPQPLLLLMLTLYYTMRDEGDAAWPLPMNGVTTLYERLLTLFVRRQIRKHHCKMRPEAVEAKVDEELDLLSVIAVGMFNRGSQGVTAEEADHDLTFLRAPGHTGARRSTRLLFGEFFFFIHEAKATFDGGEDRVWYEFLHATFGEYLVARKIARTLRHCPDQGPYEGLLFALLSFAPLTDRAQIIDYLGDLLPGTDDTVTRLFPQALHGLPPGSDTGYTLGPVPVTFRHACYSANLLLLAMATGRLLRFSELITEGELPAEVWRTHATLWKSQLPPASWDAFVGAVGTVPVPTGQGVAHLDLVLRLGQHDAHPEAPTTSWLLRTVMPGIKDEPLSALLRTRPLYDPDAERLVEPSLPVFDEFTPLTSSFTLDSAGRPVSAAHALIALLICPPAPHQDVLPRYETCLAALPTLSGSGGARLLELISRRLATESESLPSDAVDDIVQELTKLGGGLQESDELDRARISLLVTSCRLLDRTRSEGLVGRIVTLLGADISTTDLSAVETRLVQGEWRKRRTNDGGIIQPLMEALFHFLIRPAEGGEGQVALLRLLRLAVALDQGSWCRRYAERALRSLRPDIQNRLLPFEADYLGSSLAVRLDVARQRAHP